jgi:uncharacterized protein
MKCHPRADHCCGSRATEESVTLDEQRSRAVTGGGDRGRTAGVTSPNDENVDIAHAGSRSAMGWPRLGECSHMLTTIDPAEREERSFATAAHLSAITVGFIVPFGNVVGPLVIYMTNRGKRPFAAAHAKASLNFQLVNAIVTLVIVVVAGLFFLFVFTSNAATHGASLKSPAFSVGFAITFIAIFAGFIFGVCGLVWAISGAIAANKGLAYSYPITIDFVK